jgi:hypothetical protein
VDLLGDPLVIGQLLSGGEVEAGVVLIAVDVVGLDRVKALLGAHRKARAHDRLEHRQLGDVQPVLAGPTLYAAALDRGGKA